MSELRQEAQRLLRGHPFSEHRDRLVDTLAVAIEAAEDGHMAECCFESEPCVHVRLARMVATLRGDKP